MKYIFLLLIVAFAAADSIPPFEPLLNDSWESFKSVFNKSYPGYEELGRRLIFEARVADIVRHNLLADLGFKSYRLGINKYSDMSSEEMSKHLLGFKGRSNWVSDGSLFVAPDNVRLPDTVDWRKEGLVTHVKDQGRCGACWAFSATGSLEGQHKKKTRKLVALSEQNLVDCSQKEGNNGCDGGWMDQAFTYVKNNKGIDTEKSYPYTETDGKCHFDRSKVGATVSGFVDIPSGEEKTLQIAVATVGPVSVAINADGYFNAYERGVYDPDECPNTLDDLDHGVLVVGYGTEGGKDYWLVKNSWGKSFGVNGYIKMVRNKGNKCGIATKASYPLV